MKNEDITLEISAKSMGLAMALKDGKFVITLGGEVLYSKSDIINKADKILIGEPSSNVSVAFNRGIQALIKEL